MWRIKVLFLTSVILLSINLIAQDEQNPHEKYRGFFAIAPRVGLGIHNYSNIEIGLSGLYIDNEDLGFGASSLYSTFILQQSSWQSGYDAKGFKFGVQSSWLIIMWGIEYKQLFYSHNQGYYLSPKVGLSVLDVVNVEYAINILNKGINESFPIYSKHQVSINFSINRKLYREIYKGFIFTK